MITEETIALAHMYWAARERGPGGDEPVATPGTRDYAVQAAWIAGWKSARDEFASIARSVSANDLARAIGHVPFPGFAKEEEKADAASPVQAATS